MTQRVKDHIHSSRTQIDGRAFGVTALAQTSDGYLWIGTGSGILRYDGLAATRWEPQKGERLPAEVIAALCVTSSGALWIGTSAGLSRLADGHLITYTQREGLPVGQVLAIVEDSAGVVWAGTGSASGGGLVSIERGDLKRHKIPSESSDLSVLSLFEDGRHNLWIGTTQGLYRRTAGTGMPASIEKEHAAEVISITEDSRQHLLFIESGRRGVSFRGAPERSIQTQADSILVPSRVLRDRRGSIWVGTAGQGVFRLRNGKLEHFSRRDGLSGDLVTALLEDAEGNLWVGTTAGLDQFREPDVARWSTAEGLSGNVVTAVLAESKGGVCAGILGGGLDELQNGKFSSRLTDTPWKHATVMALHEDRGGRLWVATTLGLGFLRGRQLVEVRAADGRPVDHGFAITHDAAGNLWIADTRLGLLKVRAGKRVAEGLPGIAARNVYALHARGNGEMWVGYFEGGITVMDPDGRILGSHDARSGVAPGSINDFYEDGSGAVWTATAGGLSRFRNGRWTTWTEKQLLPKGGVHAMIEDRSGRLWMTTAAGLLHMGREQFDMCPDGRAESLSFAVIGPGEGFRPRRTRTPFTPRMALSSDGRLWISTEDGLANIDPARIRRGTRSTPVAISRVSVDGSPTDPRRGEIAFRGRVVELEYTAPTFIAPEAVRFRHKLDGFERDWSDSGTSRRIAYANLPPGRHVFRVMATNADGTWNESAATLILRRVPYFYQTTVFVALCVIAAGFCTYIAYRFRVRQLRSRFQLVLQERSRLTREIHDTVLQGFAGVVYQLDAASCCFDETPQMSKQMLDRALNRADQSLQEARRAISCMRVPVLETNSLPDALSMMGKQALEATSVGFDVKVKGRARQLRHQLETALYLIAREAVTNAVNHAKANRISLALIYSRAEVRLTVRDDGVGFDPQRLPSDSHFGLMGMRERAKEIGAAFDLSSEPGRGTTVTVAVPEGQHGGEKRRPGNAMME